MLIPTFIKDPSASLDYGFDWLVRAWLAAGETIVTSVWTVPAGLSMITSGLSGGKSVVWLAGGVVGVTYTVTNTITTSAGRTDERSIQIQVLER